MDCSKIAAITVLYNPDRFVAPNINTYLNIVGKLYLIDNSENFGSNLLGDLIIHPKVRYVRNFCNLGIAEALNIGIKLAFEDRFEYFLTMDQDSAFEVGDFEKLANCLDKIDQTVGMISPLHKQNYFKKGLEEVQFVMTSGNILMSYAWIKAGEFMGSLFIDHVDHEYCLRLTNLGFKIIVVNDVVLNHSLGHIAEFKFFEYTIIKFIAHEPLRTYYIIRNGLFVGNLYKRSNPGFLRQCFGLIFKEIIKICFLEKKIQRIKYVFLALNHFRNFRLGRF